MSKFYGGGSLEPCLLGGGPPGYLYISISDITPHPSIVNMYLHHWKASQGKKGKKCEKCPLSLFMVPLFEISSLLMMLVNSGYYKMINEVFLTCLALMLSASKCPFSTNCWEANLILSILSWCELTSASRRACFFCRFCTLVKS